MINKRLVIEILTELRRHKIGMIGLVLLLIEIGMVVFFPIIANPADIDHWYDFNYWERERMTPKLAPPAWVSYLDPNSPPPTTYLKPQVIYEVYDFRDYNQYKEFMLKKDPSLAIKYRWGSQALDSLLRTLWEQDRQRIGKVVLIKVIYTYNFDKKRAPLDIRFQLKLDFDHILYKDPFWKQGIGLYIRRPDNIIVSLIPGYDYPTNFYDVNQYADIRDKDLLRVLTIPFITENGQLILCNGDQKWFLSIKSMISKFLATSTGMEVEDILEPILEEAGENMTFREYVDVFTVLFSKASKGVLSGESGALNGVYTFELDFFLRLKPGDTDIEPRVEPEPAMIAGCYGLLGTDNRGRDLWSAIVYGIGWALFFGVVVSVITTILGALYGTISAYFGGTIDAVMQQIARVYVSIPAFPLLILLSYTMGSSIWLLIIFLVVFGWMGGQFTVRSMVLQIREQTYIEAARALGASNRRIVFRYVFPQVTPYLFAVIALGVPGAILTEAGLSFLGLGDPKIVTWGKILYDAGEGGAFMSGAWWWVISPGVMITITSLSFIMLGQAIEKIIAPKLKTR